MTIQITTIIQTANAPLHAQPLVGQGVSGYQPGTIGGDAQVCKRIEDGFTRLGAARQRNLGGDAYATTTASFKRDFAIRKSAPWTVILSWPAHRANEILNYLDGRHSEAIGHH